MIHKSVPLFYFKFPTILVADLMSEAQTAQLINLGIRIAINMTGNGIKSWGFQLNMEKEKQIRVYLVQNLVNGSWAFIKKIEIVEDKYKIKNTST